MFWRKKNIASASNIADEQGVQQDVKKGREGPKLKVVKQKEEKLSGAKRLPKILKKYLMDQYKIDEDMTNVLNFVMRKRAEKEKSYDYRIFDTEEAEAINFPIKDFTALDTHPELILYDGLVDEESDQVEMTEKRKMEYNFPLLSKSEIKEKIEALSEPGSTVYFYQARGPAAGGPLGRGAAIVELNPEYKNKKVSKYIIYTSNMVDKNLVGPRRKLWRSDSAEKTAEWIKDAHHKRVF